MNKKDWEKSKKQMQKLLEKGIAELKELAAETSYLTDATTNVIKMEVDVHRLRTRLEKTQIRLGREIARTASTDAQIKRSTQIEKLIKEIRSIEQKILEDERNIKKIPLSWKAAKEAAKKIMGSKQKGTASKAKAKSPARKKAARPKKSSEGKRISKS